MAMCELAPEFALECDFHGRRISGFCRLFKASTALTFGEDAPCGLQIGRRIDAPRHRIDDGHIDPHAGLDRPQLFESFAQLKRRRGSATKRASAALR